MNDWLLVRGVAVAAIIVAAACGSGSGKVGGGSGGSGESTSGSGGTVGQGGNAGSTSTGGSPGAGGDTTSAGGSPATGGSTSGGGTTGTGGSTVARDGGTSDGSYVADRPPGADGVLLHVVNGCSFDLYIHGTGTGAVLMPDAAKLTAGGGSQDYVAPDDWPAARVTAYLDSALKNQLDKVEMTIAKKTINYNITYVDWVGLPVEMSAFGAGNDCKKVGCYVKQADLVSTCPSGLLQGKQCLSAYGYCASGSHANDPLCHALDGQFAKCAAGGCPMATTTQVYGCNGPYGNDPKWCAALNRGRPMNPDDPDASLYYSTPPYNVYAKWVHDTCPGIYAFAYDDYGKSNQSSFHACTGGTQLNITFCPSG
ncbi:MAG TPA: beta-1,3-glucanase family protein [Polyangia bacterium]|nr:beta-1,3-glucanase family protein [Polyangia bacterium]